MYDATFKRQKRRNTLSLAVMIRLQDEHTNAMHTQDETYYTLGNTRPLTQDR